MASSLVILFLLGSVASSEGCTYTPPVYDSCELKPDWYHVWNPFNDNKIYWNKVTLETRETKTEEIVIVDQAAETIDTETWVEQSIPSSNMPNLNIAINLGLTGQWPITVDAQLGYAEYLPAMVQRLALGAYVGFDTGVN